MDEDEECPHGLDARWCAVCLHGPSKDPVAQREPERVTTTFAAGFAGHCHECNLPITPGQTIAKLEPTHRYVHKDCAPT